MFRQLLCPILFITALLCSAITTAQGFGACSAPIKAEWLPDGRQMRLLEDYVYTEQGGRIWKAPANSVVDGASIPRPLWTVVGGPFEGIYRNASVVHDVACDDQREPWSAVHRMFYSAMKCAGVGDVKAKVMYAAVYHCGPRWGPDQGTRMFATCRSGREALRTFLQMKEYIQMNPRFTLEELEKLTPERLEQWHPDVQACSDYLEEDESTTAAGAANSW